MWAQPLNVVIYGIELLCCFFSFQNVWSIFKALIFLMLSSIFNSSSIVTNMFSSETIIFNRRAKL